MKTAVLAVLLIGVALAKKGGKPEVSKNIVNPDPDADIDIESPEFNTEMTEGDIVPNGKNGEDRNAVKNENQLWPGGKVPYVMDGSLSSSMRQKVEEAINDYNTHTCVRFVRRTSERDYVFINSQKSGCYAYLGRSGGQQPLNLQDPGCKQKGTIIHEMLHTIGFAHEQSRNDRDNYITINWQNIKQGMESQFKKMAANNENDQGYGYDYDSVMHYPDWGFSKNGRPVITTRDSSKQKSIGQRAGFSKQDIQEVNSLYKCSGGKSSIGGSNGGSGGSSGGSSGGYGGRGGGGSSGCSDSGRISPPCSTILSWGPIVCRHRAISSNCKKSCGLC